MKFQIVFQIVPETFSFVENFPWNPAKSLYHLLVIIVNLLVLQHLYTVILVEFRSSVVYRVGRFNSG